MTAGSRGHSRTRRTIGTRVALLAAGVVLFVWCFADAQALKPYTLVLDFVPTGEYVPHYTALEKGWYREEGLDVKIIRGQGSADTVKRIAAGQGDVGIAPTPTRR
jgi:NitT/TauT family transport system substrate-binding protein